MRTMTWTVALVAITGCGAAMPVPADRLVRAQEAVRHAEEMPEVAAEPRASAHLELAKGQLDHAKKLMIEGHNEDARWALMRAEADAETSLYLAHAEASKADAQRTIEAIRQAMSMMQEEGSGS